MTLARNIQNINIKALDLEIIWRHTAIEIQIGDTNKSCPSTIPYFKTKNAKWSWRKSYRDNQLSNYTNSFPETVSEEVKDIQVNKLTDVAVNSATEAAGKQSKILN